MRQHNGSVILALVLVLSVVALSVTTSISLLSINTAETSYADSKGYEALGLAEGCAEDILLLARSNAAYTSSTLSRPEGTCSIAISKVGNRWTATIQSDGSYVKKIHIVFDRLGSGISLVSWRNIP